MIQVIDIHDLKPGDHIAGFGKMVRKVTWTNDFPFVEFEDGSTWDASQEKTVSVVRPVKPNTGNDGPYCCPYRDTGKSH